MAGLADIAGALAEAAREIERCDDVDTVLKNVVGVARDSIPEIDHVGITVVDGDPARPRTRTASDAVVLELDQIQYDGGEGPCLEALGLPGVVRVDRLRHEQRWPKFTAEAAELGLRSMLGVAMVSGDRPVGVLNLYSFSTDELSPDTEQLAELFAVHAGSALGHVREIEHLNLALASRKVIGMALGILMERLEIDEDTAFAYLTRMSSTTQTKLRDVAASVVDQARARAEAVRSGDLGP